MDLAATAEAIRAMRIRGATAIARAAATALADAIAAAERAGADADGQRRVARDAAATLDATRPTAVSLAAATRAVRNAALAAEQPAQAAQAGADAFVAALDAGDVAARDAAAGIIRDGETVLTICHSTQVVGAITAAATGGAGVRAVCLETRPWHQGRITAADLAAAGIPVDFMVDSAAACRLAEGDVDRVLVGADAVLASGDLVNKVGTRAVALAARDADVPLHSVASPIKFSDRFEVPIEDRGPDEVWPGNRPAGVTVRNPVFDVVPARLITGYATAAGVLGPAEAVMAHATWMVTP